MTLIESTPDAGTGALIRQDQLLMPDPESLQVLEGFSSRWPSLIPFITKPITFGLQPQLALDMIFDNHESGGSAQKETSRPAGVLSPALRLIERSEIPPPESMRASALGECLV
ncbi:hypothetical protein LI410_mgp053 (mitochondrion) [Apium graveolens]|uniref:hypothetical protein n=1 Tax=Apium graveolens TaxID=4045 RepID=UPI001D01C1A9|nr:hypothetical protein LI410_mgp126 [Apium graveolens]YP_010185173.1 hypothetical protein LI410_mgp053 [Apium graveolens]QVJ97858.1 hypothetical protein [Apium graveolens]QVJ97930.1 hypothetical protein [Apium graveolens]QVJ98020.1 hypothetical protein [Apium graveolens]QVJ98089.1 hypothetical protein [Apium graveolens]